VEKARGEMASLKEEIGVVRVRARLQELRAEELACLRIAGFTAWAAGGQAAQEELDGVCAAHPAATC
jgi:hypothetical protein